MLDISISHVRIKKCVTTSKPPPLTFRVEELNAELQVKERIRQDIVQIEGVTEDGVGVIISKIVRDEQPGCISAVEKPASAYVTADKIVNKGIVEDVLQHFPVTQVKCSEEDIGDEMDGLSQMA